MRPALTCAILLGLALSAQSAGAAVAVRLAPLPARGCTREGFLPATLTIVDANGELPGVVRAVALRRVQGGPTVLQAASVAPRAEQALEVLLPVLSAQETYAVRLLPGDDPAGPALKESRASIVVADMAAVERARNALVDPTAYDGRLEDLPRWPGGLLRTVFLTAALTCLALAATLLLRRPAARLAAVLVLAAAGAGAAAQVLSRCPVVVTRRAGDALVVTCRRTTNWRCPAAGLGPVYWSPARLDADDLVYRRAVDFTLTLRPLEPRVFRPLAPAGATATASRPASR